MFDCQSDCVHVDNVTSHVTCCSCVSQFVIVHVYMMRITSHTSRWSRLCVCVCVCVCVDIDECSALRGACANGQCINMAGSYRCDCHSGYRPSNDHQRCIGTYYCLSLAALNWYDHHYTLLSYMPASESACHLHTHTHTHTARRLETYASECVCVCVCVRWYRRAGRLLLLRAGKWRTMSTAFWPSANRHPVCLLLYWWRRLGNQVQQVSSTWHRSVCLSVCLSVTCSDASTYRCDVKLCCISIVS